MAVWPAPEPGRRAGGAPFRGLEEWRSVTHSADTTDANRPRALEAVLWDFDGTLVNTEPMWFAAETEYVTGHGAPWPPEEARGYAGPPGRPRAVRCATGSSSTAPTRR